jgi:acetyl-CoA carboxylase biotin carboxyl carrier protein
MANTRTTKAAPRRTSGNRRAGTGLARQASPAPPVQALGYADLVAIVGLIERARAFSEFRLKVGEIEIEFRRRPDAGAAGAPAPVAMPAAVPSAVPAAEAAAHAVPPSDAPLPAGTVAIAAPMVGTFYRAPAPGAPPFVEPGQRVEAGATLCIIEVMKLMNTVEAQTAGTVVEVRARDACPVGQGEVLLVFRPEA